MKKPEISNYIKKDPSELTTGEILIGYQKYAKALEKYIEEQLYIHDVISSCSIEERFRLEERLVKMVIDKRPYYKTVKKSEVVRDTVSDLLDAIIQNGK